MSAFVRIGLLRPLARLRPQRWGPRLAEALVTRSQQMIGLPGETARRAAAAQQAVVLCRRLADGEPDDRGRLTLARALVARAAVADGQSLAEAVDQLCEAIGYVEDAPDRAGLAVLAAARGLLARNIYQRGDVREALTTALGAQATWDACGQLNPPERMRLASALLLIGDCRQALGQAAEALTARRHALKLYRSLSFPRQSKWIDLGVTAATNVARSLAATGEVRAALALLAASRPNAELWCRLQPRNGRLPLAQALLVEAECRASLGEPEVPVRLAEQAVDLQRRQAAIPGGGGERELAAGLYAQCALLLGAGQRTAGIARLAESVEVARGVDDAQLARSLLALTAERMTDQRWDAVEPLLDELLTVCRRWADKLPEVFRPLLVKGLNLVVAMTAFEAPAGDKGAGAPPVDRIAGLDGVTAGRESALLARRLTEGDPRYRTLLGQSLFAADRAVNRAGEPQEAADLLHECVALRRGLYAENPAVHRVDLADALGHLGNRLWALDRPDDALEAHRECVALLRAAGPDAPPQQLAMALRNITWMLTRLGRTGEAERAAAEAGAANHGPAGLDVRP